MNRLLKWIAGAVLVLAAGATPAAAQNIAVRGWCEAGATPVVTSGLTSQTLTQASFPSCTVTVNITGGGAATIFSNATGTPLANPFTAQTNGQWIFFVAVGTYDVVNSGGGLTSPITYSSISVGGSGGGGGGSTAFNAITTGVNTAATMTVSTGATLNHSGSGVVDASSINGVDITGTPLPGQIPIATGTTTATWQTANPLDCSSAIYAGADFGATWNNCLAAAPAGSVISFAHFTSPQVMTTAVDVNKSVWNDMAGLDVTQQAAITISTTAVVARGEFDQGFNGDQFTITTGGTILQNNTIYGNDGTNTGRGVVISSGTNVILDTNTVAFHNGNEIQDDGGTSFAPNTIKNGSITFDGGAGLSSTGGTNVLNTNFNWGGTGAGNAILQPSIAFYSLIRVDHSTFNGNQAAAMISAPNNSAIVITNSQSFSGGGYPTIDDPNGGLLQVQLDSLTGGGANGPLIRYNTNINAGSALDISHNYNLSALSGAAVIDASLAQGAKIDGNDNITSDFSGLTGGCAVKIEGALGGSVSDNGISVVGYAAFTGPNYGFCFKTVSSQHNDNLYVHHNTITGQSSSGANSVGMIFDNSANVAPDFADGNIWDSNFCIDIGTCITRVSPSWNNSNVYSNNGGVALAQVYDTTGSTNDGLTGFSTTFAAIPVAGNGSQGYCTDCTQGIPTAGGGSGAEIFRINGQWAGLGGTLTSWASVSAGTNANAGTFSMSANAWDATAASHTLPIKSGTIAAKPATCTFTAGSKMEIYVATDATAGQNLYFCTATNTWTQQLNSGAAGANTTLSNLGVTAINAGLFPTSAATIPVGSTTLPYSDVFIGSVGASKGIHFVTAAPTAVRTVTAPDANTVLPIANAGTAGQFLTSLSAGGVLGVSALTYSGNTTELATVTGAVTSGHAAGWDASGNLVDAGTAVTNSSTNTFTNKTINQEGTGNVITTVWSIYFDAAGCNNATAAPTFDLPSSSAPTPNCLTGTNTNQGTLDFDDSGPETGQIKFALPHTVTGAIDIQLYWLVTAAGGSNAVKWTVQTAYTAGAATYDTAYNAAQTITSNVAANNIVVEAAQTGLTQTGLAVDDLMHLKIGRDTTDTFTGTARLMGVRITGRKTGS